MEQNETKARKSDSDESLRRFQFQEPTADRCSGLKFRGLSRDQHEQALPLIICNLPGQASHLKTILPLIFFPLLLHNLSYLLPFLHLLPLSFLYPMAPAQLFQCSGILLLRDAICDISIHRSHIVGEMCVNRGRQFVLPVQYTQPASDML